MAVRTEVNTVLTNLAMTMQPFLVGTGKPLVELVKYAKTNFDGKSPVGLLSRSNSRLQPLTARGSELRIRVDMNFLVLRVDPADSTYTEEDAEYALSACVDAFAKWLDFNRSRKDLGWHSIVLEQNSIIRSVVDDGGSTYWMETYLMEVVIK